MKVKKSVTRNYFFGYFLLSIFPSYKIDPSRILNSFNPLRNLGINSPSILSSHNVHLSAETITQDPLFSFPLHWSEPTKWPFHFLFLPVSMLACHHVSRSEAIQVFIYLSFLLNNRSEITKSITLRHHFGHNVAWTWIGELNLDMYPIV